MAKPSCCNPPPPEKQAWGTWEELLLACAVHRYGPDSWDSVASEVQRRSPSLRSLTGLSCKLKYHDLRRRFRGSGNHDDAVSPGPDAETTNNNNNDSGNNDNDNNASVPWLEELRQLRVAELRREVERYDLSIVSLQLKVKRLTEEREKGIPEKEATDLATVGGKTPEKVNSGEDSDRENRSVNESNSTDPKSGSPEAGAGEDRKPPSSGPATEDPSCNSVAEEPAGKNNEAFESAGEEWTTRPDGGGGGEGKESSEVQSSASLARREQEKTGKAGEVDNEGDRSLAVRCVGVESQPLFDFLEILRSHKLGSFFQRRLETQETNIYTNLIRQHLDLETVRSRLEEGWYSACNKFFRDLLIIFNNAITFFHKQSPEYLAAIELRKLVSKEMAHNGVQVNPSPKEKPLELQEQELENSLEAKPKMRVVMVACRKRSSITTKASPLFSGGAKKGEERTNSSEKPAVDLKKQEKSSFTKKRTREKPIPSGRTTTTNKNSKTRSSTSTGANKHSDGNSKGRGSSSRNAMSQAENEESRAEKEMKGGSANPSKKKGAAGFLNRMKQGSPSASNEPLLESLRQPGTGSYPGKGKEVKRNSSSSGSDARRTQTSRKASGGKPESQRTSPMKKGRPPKRAAAPPSPPRVAPGKRSREHGAAGAPSSAPAKKRSRR